MRRPLLGFGAFVVASVLVTTLIWNTLARTVPGPTNTYTVLFADVQGLRVGDDVRMAGVRVGRVEAIDVRRDPVTRDHLAEVTVVVQRAHPVFDDTRVLVRHQNLIGQRYVAMVPGGAATPAPLPDTALIPVTRTEPSFDISVLLDGFRPLFQILRPDQVNRLSETLVLALQGDGVSVSAFVVQAAQLAADFHRRDAILTDVIVELSRVTGRLAAHGSSFETLVAQTRSLLDGLTAQGTSLITSTERIAVAASALTTMVGAAQDRLRRAQDSSATALTLMLGIGPRLDHLADDLPAFLANFGVTFGEGTFANAYMCRLDIALYDILLPRGIVSSIGGDAQSVVCR